MCETGGAQCKALENIRQLFGRFSQRQMNREMIDEGTAANISTNSKNPDEGTAANISINSKNPDEGTAVNISTSSKNPEELLSEISQNISYLIVTNSEGNSDYESIKKFSFHCAELSEKLAEIANNRKEITDEVRRSLAETINIILSETLLTNCCEVEEREPSPPQTPTLTGP